MTIKTMIIHTAIRILGKVANDKTQIHAFARRFNFGIYLLRVIPGISLVTEGPYKLLMPGPLLPIVLIDPVIRFPDRRFQAGVRCKANAKIKVLLLHYLIKTRAGKPAISPDDNLNIPKALADFPGDYPQKPVIPFIGVYVAGAQYRQDDLFEFRF